MIGIIYSNTKGGLITSIAEQEINHCWVILSPTDNSSLQQLCELSSSRTGKVMDRDHVSNH